VVAVTEFDNLTRAALHAAVDRETAGNFWIWASVHDIPVVEVFEAAHMGGTISDRVRAAAEPRE
jgi:hypothetical protein